MNWKQEATNDLINYARKKESLENMKNQMGALKVQFVSIQGAATDKEPVMGGASKLEDRQLDNIVKRQRLNYTYQATKRLVDIIERGIAGLNEQERKVIERFYIYRTKDYLERIMDETGYERAQVYRIKDDALYKFTIYMYGISEY
jgi:ArpU family phage transcriptional regulator